ncbi:hypothetical protein PV04_07181 [Phialophora macrospora]|uniref:Transcription factor domain-containing protein n=1 Tax=Phialophora macrospora TaxID=1851006 RepID=A0A0D2DRP8_9EURO|nr:hypothetical protein PV04_07181 [Phialophora macrospora]
MDEPDAQLNMLAGSEDWLLDLQHLIPTETSGEEGDATPAEDIDSDQLALASQPPAESSELWVYNTDLLGNFCLDEGQSPADRLAFTFFMQFVSRIIPAYDGPRSGYRELATYALTSPVLMDTVLSVATGYMSQRGGAPMVLALARQSRALKTLRETLLSPSASSTSGPGDHLPPLIPKKSWTASVKQEILATIALQMSIEMLNGGPGVKTHLQYGVNLIDDLGWIEHREDSFIGRVLLYRIAFIDIVASFLWHRRPLLPPTFWLFKPEADSGEVSGPSLQDMTGCPHRVFSFLAEISHLASDSDRRDNDTATDTGTGTGTEGNDHPPDVMTKAHALETHLRNYGSTAHLDLDDRAVEQEEDEEPAGSRPDQSTRHLHTVSRCYYWTTHLLLQRRVCRDPRASRRVQFSVRQLIDLMDSLPIGCGPDSSLSLPLYTAAYEAVDQGQRRRILRKSKQLAEEYPSKTREAMNDSIQAIWAARDESQAVDQENNTTADTSPDVVRSETLVLI